MTPLHAGPEKTVPIFDVQNVTYRYHQATALDGLSLVIQPGERYALLGANGSGKSTLLRILDGLYYPEKGTVLFCGQPLTEDRLRDGGFGFDFRRRVGLVFQNPDVQLFSPSVFDEIAFGPLQLRWPRQQTLLRVKETMELMEITHLKDRPPHELSNGEKKRVALASVLVLDPEVLLLDEPTASLDPRSESHMIDFLVGWRGGAKTVVTTTHNMDIVEDIADRCYVFESGRVTAEGTPAAILADTPMLERAHLIHTHRHIHASGEVHSHPHLHRHQH
ncbi:MAG TPA: ABC transporter ATP-binding protein [Terriglobia bacterium]|nr:ABC transporter ATP-binding protein [Terriglobia bacterium]